MPQRLLSSRPRANSSKAMRKIIIQKTMTTRKITTKRKMNPMAMSETRDPITMTIVKTEKRRTETKGRNEFVYMSAFN